MLAKEAGVSIATISRVINNDPRVLPETRSKILDLARRRGYLPGPANGMRTIGVLIQNNSMNPYHFNLQEAVRKAIAEKGWRTELVAQEDVELLHDRAVSGVIAICQRQDYSRWWDEHGNNIPLVPVNSAGNSMKGIYSCISDGRTGIKLAFRHLAEYGHRKIIFLSSVSRKEEAGYISRKIEGFYECLRGMGENNPENCCFYNVCKHPPDFRGLIAEGFTAGIAGGEPCGFQLLQHLNRQRIRCPDDFSLVSMEYPEISEFLYPPLTTVSQDFKRLAAQAVQLLEQHFNPRRLIPGKDIHIPYFLIRRDSVKRLRRNASHRSSSCITFPE